MFSKAHVIKSVSEFLSKLSLWQQVSNEPSPPIQETIILPPGRVYVYSIFILTN